MSCVRKKKRKNERDEAVRCPLTLARPGQGLARARPPLSFLTCAGSQALEPRRATGVGERHGSCVHLPPNELIGETLGASAAPTAALALRDFGIPLRAFCSFSECDKREYRECADGRERLRKSESATSGGTEKNATRQSINSNCFLMLTRLRTLKMLAPIASSSRASEHVFLPVSVLCVRAYREA